MSIHNMTNWMIDTFGTTEQRKQWVPHMSAMTVLGSYCLTEPSSGSDAASLKTTARRVGDNYILNGTKAFISGAGSTDVYLVMCRTGGDSPSGISCMIVPKDAKGLSFGKKEEKLGWNSQPTRMVIMEDCVVPAQNILGKEGDGFKIAMKGLDGGRINIAGNSPPPPLSTAPNRTALADTAPACSLGAAHACVESTIAYVKDRKQFKTPISDFQNTQVLPCSLFAAEQSPRLTLARQFVIADSVAYLQASRSLVRAAAVLLQDRSPDATVASAMAKRFATNKVRALTPPLLTPPLLT
jgi:alkylation response protein AidB-like acyl-CoA dehydrogenase